MAIDSTLANEVCHLNSFQRMMLKWNTLTPYNAGHVIHLKGIPDIPSWEKSIIQTIKELELGYPEFFDEQKRFTFKTVDILRIEEVHVDLDCHIQNELNRPFNLNDFPIRFFIKNNEDKTYYLGAIYNHWLADSYAMRALLQRIYNFYYNLPALPPLTLRAPSFSLLFRRFLGKFPKITIFKEFIQRYFYYQRAFRVKLKNVIDFNTGFNRYYLKKDLIHQLIGYAKQNQVSINDIFLAVLAKTLGEFTCKDRKQPKRKKMRFFTRNALVLGTIVDMRAQAAKQLENVFGQYLSNYTVILKDPEANSFPQLLKKISRQTIAIKKSFKTIKNFASWDLSLLIWKFIAKPKSQSRFFTKNAPIIAGISNVNLTSSWIGEAKSKQGEILDYLRISPTGVLLPLVFTITTLHETLSICVSYRTTAFQAEDINHLSHSFMNFLNQIVGSGLNSQ